MSRLGSWAAPSRKSLNRSLLGALALCALGSGARAADVKVTTAKVPAQAIPAVARLAEEGIGYSVLQARASRGALSYRVKVVCTVGQLSATATCPSMNYGAFCPAATIVCQ